VFKSNGSGLTGHAKISFASDTAHFIYAKAIDSIRIEGICLVRTIDSSKTPQAILLENCRNILINQVQILENRSMEPTIQFRECEDSRVTDCTILNYKQFGLNVRPTQSFNCIDGHGMAFHSCRNTYVSGNSVIDRRIFPDPETKAKHDLGKVVSGVSPAEGMPDYFPAWHQGAGIGSFRGACSTIVNNYIENAAQGVDFQTDYSILAGNIITYAQTGIKCMHFTQNVVITNNNVSYCDLWGLVTAPGPTSHPAYSPTEDEQLSEIQKKNLARFRMVPGQAEVNSGNIISGNVFSNFGYGHEYYNWGSVLSIDESFLCIINLWGQWESMQSSERVQFHPESGMKSILVQGNLVYNNGQDGYIEDGKPVFPKARYRYALFHNQGPYKPTQVFMSGNLLHEGSEGVCNRPLTEQEKLLNYIVQYQEKETK
jgi:hypothetical protein